MLVFRKFFLTYEMNDPFLLWIVSKLLLQLIKQHLQFCSYYCETLYKNILDVLEPVQFAASKMKLDIYYCPVRFYRISLSCSEYPFQDCLSNQASCHNSAQFLSKVNFLKFFYNFKAFLRSFDKKYKASQLRKSSKFNGFL